MVPAAVNWPGLMPPLAPIWPNEPRQTRATHARRGNGSAFISSIDKPPLVVGPGVGIPGSMETGLAVGW